MSALRVACSPCAVGRPLRTPAVEGGPDGPGPVPGGAEGSGNRAGAGAGRGGVGDGDSVCAGLLDAASSVRLPRKWGPLRLSGAPMARENASAYSSMFECSSPTGISVKPNRGRYSEIASTIGRAKTPVAE